MKKLITLIFLALSLSFNSFAQNELTFENPTLKKDNKVYHLIGFTNVDEPIVRIEEYTDSGKLYQSGNSVGGKLDGIWKRYDQNGNITATLKYNMGEKKVLTTYTNKKKTIIRYIKNQPYKTMSILYLD